MVPPSASTSVLTASAATPVSATTATISLPMPSNVLVRTTAATNGIDTEVSKHRTVSVLNFQSIEVSTDD